MQTIPLYQVDAFATQVFKGNPAAVCLLDTWFDDAVLTAIAAENNLSETAFVMVDATGAADYGLRWFTPVKEMDLCGHATLASAWVLFHERGVDKAAITFTTRSGVLTVTRDDDDRLTMDFPTAKVMPAPHPDGFDRVLGCAVREFWRSKNGKNIAVLDNAEAVLAVKPNRAAILALGGDGLVVTAPGAAPVDFVSRYFAPHVGIDEDPVTGSTHTALVPYWAKRLGKDELNARQVSARGGDLLCRLAGERVMISGRAVLYMKGEAVLP